MARGQAAVMQASEPVEQQRGQRADLRALTLGWAVLLAAILPFASGRLTTTCVVLMVAAVIGLAPSRSAALTVVTRAGPVWWGLGAFLLYAAVSATWAVRPTLTLSKVAWGVALSVGVMVTARLLAEEPLHHVQRMGEGLAIGLGLGLAYFLVEALTQQSIRIFLYNALHLTPDLLRPGTFVQFAEGRLVGIASDDLKRSVAAVPMLMWSAILVSSHIAAGPWRRYAPTALGVLASTVILTSSHGASKAALLVSLPVALIAWRSASSAHRLVQGAWLLACLGAVPLAVLLPALDLQHASWVPYSFQHRIVIWGETAAQFVRSPILGIGADMTYVLGPQTAPLTQDPVWRPTLAQHAHNAYLQTWLELGAFGAVLLLVAGLGLIHAIKSLPDGVKPHVYATFASAATVSAASYGLWQSWYMALLALAALMHALALRAGEVGGAGEPQAKCAGKSHDRRPESHTAPSPAQRGQG